MLIAVISLLASSACALLGTFAYLNHSFYIATVNYILALYFLPRN